MGRLSCPQNKKNTAQQQFSYFPDGKASFKTLKAAIKKQVVGLHHDLELIMHFIDSAIKLGMEEEYKVFFSYPNDDGSTNSQNKKFLPK